MTKQTESKTFYGKTSNEAEENANKWLEGFLREDRSKRTAWNDAEGNYCVIVEGVK